MRSCLRALAGDIPAEVARQAFVAAAREVGIFIREAPLRGARPRPGPSIIAQGLIVLAFRQAGASLLAPFFYTQLIWSAGLGYLVFSNLPDRWSFVGAGIIIASGLYTAHRECTRAAERSALRKT